MGYEVIKRPQARKDIESAAKYIAEDNLVIAQNFITAVENSCGQLAQFPHLGGSYSRTIRKWPVNKYPNYLIFYTVLENRVDILRVLHSAREVSNIFP